MTQEEKIEAYEKYKAKLAIIGKQEIVDKSFDISDGRILIDIVTFAETQGCPEKLIIPDFVDQIVSSYTMRQRRSYYG